MSWSNSVGSDRHHGTRVLGPNGAQMETGLSWVKGIGDPKAVINALCAVEMEEILENLENLPTKTLNV